MYKDVKMSISILNLPSPWLCISSSLVVCMLILVSPNSQPHSILDKDAELQKIFQLRNEDEWKSAWHLEKHVRCRDQLLTHMDWACQKDVYRLDKKPKASPRHEALFIKKLHANSFIKPWTGYVRRKRENKSITDECCSAAGCTWEEYAEYCPAHRRYRVTRSRSN